MTETNAERLMRIREEYYVEDDIDWLIEQAEQIPAAEENLATFLKNNRSLRKENVRLIHEVWLLRQGKFYKDWFEDNLRLIAERKQFRDQLDKIKTLVNSSKAGYRIKTDLEIMFREEEK